MHVSDIIERLDRVMVKLGLPADVRIELCREVQLEFDAFSDQISQDGDDDDLLGGESE